jgi:hypothetical protein
MFNFEKLAQAKKLVLQRQGGSSSSSSSSCLKTAVPSSASFMKDRPHFHEQTNKYQTELKRNIKRKFDESVDDANITRQQDVDDVLQYIKEDYEVADTGTLNFRGVVENQLKKLSLPNRNTVISLLTHDQNGSVNEDVLKALPGLRQRSNALLMSGGERKVRSDKIDLEFVNRYMHDYCRYYWTIFMLKSPQCVLIIFICALLL